MAETLWTENETVVLLEAYSDRYQEVLTGSAPDWNSVVEEVNWAKRPEKPDKDWKQVKKKIQKLKKKYKKERKAVQAGGLPSTWQYYEEIDGIIGNPPRARGIPGACDAGVAYGPPVHEVVRNPLGVRSKSVKKSKKQRYSCGLSHAFGNTFKELFAQRLKDREFAAQRLKDRLEREEWQSESNERWRQFQINTQIEMAKLYLMFGLPYNPIPLIP